MLTRYLAHRLDILNVMFSSRNCSFVASETKLGSVRVLLTWEYEICRLTAIPTCGIEGMNGAFVSLCPETKIGTLSKLIIIDFAQVSNSWHS